MAMGLSDLNSVINKSNRINRIISQYKLVFEHLWHFGINATKKIPHIETKSYLDSVMREVDKKGIKQFVEKLINTSEQEVLFYASTLWGSDNFISKDHFGLLKNVFYKIRSKSNLSFLLFR